MKFNVQELREKKGISQDELAKRCGISRTIISGLESGKIKNSTTNTIAKIAEVLDVKVSDIFFESDV